MIEVDRNLRRKTQATLKELEERPRNIQRTFKEHPRNTHIVKMMPRSAHRTGDAVLAVLWNGHLIQLLHSGHIAKHSPVVGAGPFRVTGHVA